MSSVSRNGALTQWTLAAATLFGLGGCAGTGPFLPSSGPSAVQVREATTVAAKQIEVMDIDPELVNTMLSRQKQSRFSDIWGNEHPVQFALGLGDVLEVSIWEAPPAALFGATMADTRAATATARVSVLPEQMINADGQINVPFVGLIKVAGRTAQQVEAGIVNGLKGKANQPQALVRVLRNVSSNVTVVGEVAQNTRLPLTPKGERLLDALAAAGGSKQSVSKITLQVTRGNVVRAMPLDAVIEDPKQNILMQPSDVVTALYQPFSLTVLGATGANREMEFEARGITLAQALGRSGGLQDMRADARGVFVFRFEEPAMLPRMSQTALRTAQGKVPVVYRLDLNDPASFFAAQDFPTRHKDVVYVANAPGAELQKFLNIVGSVIGPLAVMNSLKN